MLNRDSQYGGSELVVLRYVQRNNVLVAFTTLKAKGPNIIRLLLILLLFGFLSVILAFDYQGCCLTDIIFHKE